MLRLRQTLLISAVSIATTQTTSARSGIEAVNLMPVAIKTSVDCNRSFFQSSQHFKNTIFMMPRVIPGSGPDDNAGFSFASPPDPGPDAGNFYLDLRLFFPSDNDFLRPRYAHEIQQDRDNCNIDKVISALAEANPKAPKVNVISHIPLTSIEVNLFGISSPGLIGRKVDLSEEVDQLEYSSKVLTAHFVVTNAERLYFLRQIRDPNGIPATIKFRFQGRPNVGSVHAEVVSSELQQNFKLNVGGDLAKKLARAEIQLALQSSINSKVIVINSEAGTSEAFNDLARTLATNILAEVDRKIAKQITEPADERPTNPTAEAKITVAAALLIIAESSKQELQINQTGLPESATMQSEVKIDVRSIRDANIVQVLLRAEEVEQPSTGIELKANDIVKITPVDYWVNRIHYDQNRNLVKSYMTVSEIQKYKLAPRFRELMDTQMYVDNITIGGNTYAIGRRRLSFGEASLDLPLLQWRWALYRVIPDYEQDGSGRFDKHTQEEFSELPITISFSDGDVGQEIPVNKLFEPNSDWEAIYDTFKTGVILRAKKDLGMLQIKQKMHGPENIERLEGTLVTEYAVQESWVPFRGLLRETEFRSSAPQELKWYHHPLIKQKVIRMFITRPNGPKSLNFSGSIGPPVVATPAMAPPLPMPAFGNPQCNNAKYKKAHKKQCP